MSKLDTATFHRVAVSFAVAALLAAVGILGAARPAEAAGDPPAPSHCAPIHIITPTAA